MDLTFLEVSHSGLGSGVLPELVNLSQLRSLVLPRGLDLGDGRYLRQLDKLEYLNAENCRLDVTCAERLAQLKELRDLELRDVLGLNVSTMRALLESNSLQELTIGGNRITIELFQQIVDSCGESLTELGLAGSDLSPEEVVRTLEQAAESNRPGWNVQVLGHSCEFDENQLERLSQIGINAIRR